MNRTHDGRPVYPAGAELPPGAVGWTQCRNMGAAYSVWLDDQDRARSATTYAEIERVARSWRSHKQADEALASVGIRGFGGKLDHKRSAFMVARYAQLWPLREAP